MIAKQLKWFIFFICVFADASLFSQILPFHNYTMANGLVSDNIHSMCQDSLGYIWTGTGEGLSRFDSKEFHNYSTADGLTSEKVLEVVADRKVPGVVWIGTEGGGVDKFIDDKFEAFGLGLSPSMKVIDALYLNKNNILWCGTDSGLFNIEKDSINIFPRTYKLGSITSITSDLNNNLWFASEKGIFELSAKKHLLKPVAFPTNMIRWISQLFRNKKGEIWASTLSGYFYKIYPYSKSPAYINFQTSILKIIEDEKDNFWIGTSVGIFKLKETDFPHRLFEKLTTENGLLENNITSLLLDRENILWVGTNDDGLQKLVHQNLVKFHIPKKYISENYSSISVDINNHFWISLAKGLMEAWQDKSKKWHLYFHLLKHNISNDYLPAIYCNNSNLIYMAYSNGNIKIYKIVNKEPLSINPSNLKLNEHFNLADKLKFYGIFTIYRDKRNYIWCSALDLGVVVIGPTKKRKIVKIYTEGDGLPDNSVRKIYQDSDGNFWFGGYAHGLSEFSLGKVLSDLHLKLDQNAIFTRHFSVINGLPDNGIRSISEDKKGDLLIGTRYGGLAVLSGRKFRIISRAQGLYSNAIWSITKTPGNEFWLGTQSGVQKINSDLKPEFILGDELPKEPYYSITCSKNNVLCFVNNTDIYIYEPSREAGKILPPPVYLSHLLINGQEEKIKNNLSLPSFQNTITFEFIGIINRGENLTKYFYRLLNTDKKWNLLKDRNSITYASLSPGSYTFQVIAEDNNNIKSTHPAELTFTIAEPFYEQWWFISIILIILILTLILTTKLRINRLLEIEKVRTRIAADLHDEIGSGLTKIAILSEYALQDETKNEKLLEESRNPNSDDNSIQRVGKIARNLVDSMMDVIWAIDPKYDSLQDFIFNFKNYAYEVCEAKNIKLKIETNDIGNIKVNSQTKRCLQLISKESLNNSLKYSRCSNIVYTLSVKSRNIILRIEDNGVGFDSSNTKYGRGISNMEKLVNELTGKFDLETGPGKGTKISFIIPLKY